MDNVELAIGLSGAVLKLVLFSIDFVGNAKQVYKLGATDRSIDLSTITKSIAVTTASLEAQIRTTEENGLSEGQSLDVEEERLKELSKRAAEIGRELEQKLTQINTDKESIWKSFKATVVGTWNADEIKAIEKRLISIKDEMQLSILVNIRSKINQSHDEDKSRLLATLEEVANQQALSREDGKRMIEMLNNADGISQERHDILVEIGNQLLQGINALSILGPPNLHALTTLDESVRKRVEDIILNSLWYPSIRDREETIPEAHAKTFRWVFEDPRATGKTWDSFVDFLRGDQSMFWVTGKPGCGKSTLMKFINEFPKTKALLGGWARERELLLISFYFYYNGSQYQKSEIGHIRSLLYSILSQKRDLIPIAFGERFQAASERKKLNKISLPEARKALKDLILHSPNLCFFLSIDGLDEFDPEVSLSRVQSLIELTHSFAKSGNVKVLVSSRPLPEFEHGYDGHASLRVHDLTHEDIRQYANERLMNHPRMKILFHSEPKATHDLLNFIVESSLGVFLWVRLVTESLIEGLTNYDTIHDLKKRLHELPSDLEDLYRAMLNRIDSNYKRQSARLLCFVHHIQSQPTTEELSLLDLWFAENADDDTVYKTEVKPIGDEDVRERVREIETQLKSRCRGLIEAAPSSERGSNDVGSMSMVYDTSTTERRATARFIHRTVYEFLGRPTVWNEFVAKVVNPTFSVTLSLFRSSILVIKTCQHASRITSRDIVLLASYAGIRAHSAEQEREQSHSGLVHELDIAMHEIMTRYPITSQWRNISNISHPEYHWSDWCRYRVTPDWMQIKIWSEERFNLKQNPPDSGTNAHGSLLAFAAEYGLRYFIQCELSKRGRGVLKEHEFPLLGYALIPPGGLQKYHRPDIGVVKILLDEGCNPNELYKGIALWEWFLLSLPAFTTRISGDTVLSLQRIVLTIEMLLVAGANPDGRVLWEQPIAGLPERVEIAPRRNVCTLSLALTQVHEVLLENIINSSDRYPHCIEQVDETILRVIEILKKRGAMAKTWRHEESVRLANELHQRMNARGDKLEKPQESVQLANELYQRINAKGDKLKKPHVKLHGKRKYSPQRHTQKGWRERLRNKVLAGTRFLRSGSDV